MIYSSFKKPFLDFVENELDKLYSNIFDNDSMSEYNFWKAVFSLKKEEFTETINCLEKAASINYKTLTDLLNSLGANGILWRKLFESKDVDIESLVIKRFSQGNDSSLGRNERELIC